MSCGGYGTNRVECWVVRRPASFRAAWSLRDGKPVDPASPYLFRHEARFVDAVASCPAGKTVATVESPHAGASGHG
jgi:hypothetical protein